jgi:hypothetical protein
LKDVKRNVLKKEEENKKAWGLKLRNWYQTRVEKRENEVSQTQRKKRMKEKANDQVA